MLVTVGCGFGYQSCRFSKHGTVHILWYARSRLLWTCTGTPWAFGEPAILSGETGSIVRTTDQKHQLAGKRRAIVVARYLSKPLQWSRGISRRCSARSRDDLVPSRSRR